MLRALISGEGFRSIQVCIRRELPRAKRCSWLTITSTVSVNRCPSLIAARGLYSYRELGNWKRADGTRAPVVLISTLD